jgi:transposase
VAGHAEEKARPAIVSGQLRTVRQVARRLNVSESTVIRYFDAGELVGADLSPSRNKKRLLRFRDDDIDRFAEMIFRKHEVERIGSAREKKSPIKI